MTAVPRRSQRLGLIDHAWALHQRRPQEDRREGELPRPSGRALRVLFLHNLYQVPGGEHHVVKAESDLLEARGHQVRLLEVTNEAISGAWGSLKAAASAVYSAPSRRLVQAEIGRWRPEVVHVHNFFPLFSPAVYGACREAGVAVVQTLHNYRLLCPNALLLRQGRLCEECLGRPVAWPGVLHGCYRGSRAGTAAVAAMLAVHRLLGTWHEAVDAYIALTEFARSKFIEGGLPAEKVIVKPNFAADPGEAEGPGGYALFAGRLSAEKGLATLIEAYVRHDPRLPLKLAGDGPLRPVLQERVRAAGLEGVVEFLGWRDQAEVLALMHGARLVVSPSACYEGFPVSVAEAFGCGRPVVASRLGGMPEIVEDGRTGWLVPRGDAGALAEALRAAWQDPEEALRRGRAARLAYEAKYTPEANYLRLTAIYEAASRAAPGGQHSAPPLRQPVSP